MFDVVMRDLNRYLDSQDIKEGIDDYIADHEGRTPCDDCDEMNCRRCKLKNYKHYGRGW